MGATVCAAVAGAADLELVAAVDPAGPAAGSLAAGVTIRTDAFAVLEARADVVVDFTRADAAMDNLRWCAANGVHAVSGTSGLTPADIEELGTLFDPGRTDAPGNTANCAWVPNFAIGAVIMMRLSEIAARYLDAAEVIELHHDGKLDAPSGTATETARRMTAARREVGRGDWPDDPTRDFAIDGARGGAAPGGIHIHSVRLPGLVAHQEVIFGSTGQTLSIRHDSYDRGSFMPGVLLAVRGVPSRPGLTVGLDTILGL